MMAEPLFDGCRVLIVEDEMMVALFIENAFARMGFKVVGPAARVQEALALLEEQEIHAALLDINLGDGQDSFPVADALAARCVPFAFSTGYGRSGLRAPYRGRPVLNKPFRVSDLKAVFLTLLAPR